MVLLDAAVLIAIGSKEHVFHQRATKWFLKTSHNGWATCPLTENAFVRVLSHPAQKSIPNDCGKVAAALKMLCETPGHVFWPDDRSIRDSSFISTLSGTGPSQLTDLYLLALAVANEATLATLDTRIDPDLVHGGRKALFVLPAEIN